MGFWIWIECKDDSQIPNLIEKYHLDKRYKYSRYDDRLTTTVWETLECSGCTEHWDTGQVHHSAGCSECGYTGRSRRCFPFDITINNILKKYRNMIEKPEWLFKGAIVRAGGKLATVKECPTNELHGKTYVYNCGVIVLGERRKRFYHPSDLAKVD